MRVIMITGKQGQPSAIQALPLQPTFIVAALQEIMPDISESLDINTLVTNAFTANNDHDWLVSDDHHYQVRVKHDGNIMDIFETPTKTQVILKLD